MSGAEAEPLSEQAAFDRLAVSRETFDKLCAYVALLIRWQQRLNLVGPRTLADVWRRHILDSAQLESHLLESEQRIADLGSGAGLPGIVLALVTGRTVDLYESDQRKSAFLREAARLTDAPVTVNATRIEAADPTPVDVVTARACASLDRLLGYAACFAPRTGEGPVPGLFLKGARFNDELTDAQKKWRIEISRNSSVTDPHSCIIRVSAYERLSDSRNSARKSDRAN